MATLRPPFEGGNPLVVAARIVEANYPPVPDGRSPLLLSAVGAMLTADPARRPDIDDVARLISPKLMTQLDEAAPREGVSPRPGCRPTHGTVVGDS